jgi:hypothetical protein
VNVLVLAIVSRRVGDFTCVFTWQGFRLRRFRDRQHRRKDLGLAATDKELDALRQPASGETGGLQGRQSSGIYAPAACS